METGNNSVIDQLARTKGWTLFFAILLWIGAGFLVLGGIVMAVLGTAGSLAGATGANAIPGLEGAAFGIIICVLYFMIALAYIYPGHSN